MINQSGKHLLALINDILDLAKVEAGALEVHRERFDPAAVVREIGETLKPLAAEKGLAFDIGVPDEPPEVVSDEVRLKQDLLNLAGNAIKYTDEGSVALALDVDSDGTLRFVVSDTGPGIRAKDLPKIFEPFAQIDRGGGNREGTGLGLAISREYADMLGGEILVESEFGKGSVFTLVLPPG
jgi:signal transduction histidine kinase